MEESQVQALHDSLFGAHGGRRGLGTSSFSSGTYSWSATLATTSSSTEKQSEQRTDGLPNNALYQYFVKEGTYNPNCKKTDGDGRRIKRNFDDCHDVSETDEEEQKRRRKEQRKALKKAKRKEAKLAAKKAAKLAEKKRLRKELKRKQREEQQKTEDTADRKENDAEPTRKKRKVDKTSNDVEEKVTQSESRRADKEKKSKKDKKKKKRKSQD